MSKIQEQQIQFKKDEVLFHEGDPGDFFYFVIRGFVGVFCGGDKQIPLAVIGKLQAVGDLAAIHHDARAATAIALTDVSVIKIQRGDVEEQLRLCPPWFSTILTMLVGRLRDTNEIIRRNRIRDPELVSSIAAITDEQAKVPRNTTRSRAKKAETQSSEPSSKPKRLAKFKRGEIIFHEGDEAQFFYFIKKGSVGIFRDYEETRIPLAKVREKQVLGEMALIDGQLRSATAVALTDVEALRISDKLFNHRLEAQRPWFKAVVKTIVARLRKSIDTIEKSRVRDRLLVRSMREAFVDPTFRKAEWKVYELDEEQSVVPGAEEPKAETKPATERPPRYLLIVGAGLSFCEQLSSGLAKSGVKVVVCATNEEALRKLPAQKFSCVLITLRPKKELAIKLLRKVRFLDKEAGKPIPIYLLAPKQDAAVVNSVASQISGTFVPTENALKVISVLEPIFSEADRSR